MMILDTASRDGRADTVTQNIEDKDLSALAGQVSNHMESMRGNLQQLEGVMPQLGRSRAALQGLLFKHLEQEQYEQTLLG
jgi:hypothetical protein